MDAVYKYTVDLTQQVLHPAVPTIHMRGVYEFCLGFPRIVEIEIITGPSGKWIYRKNFKTLV